MRMGWSDNGEKPNGHQLTVKEALHNVAQDTFYRLLLPDWTLGLTERTRAIKLCFEELEVSKRGNCILRVMLMDVVLALYVRDDPREANRRERKQK